MIKKNEVMGEINYLEQEDMNEIYRHKDQFPLGCLSIIALFISLIVLLIYVVMNYRF
jgi:hypothetical protein